jgi:hypothetical protein
MSAPTPESPAARPAQDPVVIAVLLACALGLAAIWLAYLR